MIVGVYAIFIPVALILYFSFREGILGGFITTIVTILYYVYIIHTRHYKGSELTTALETTTILALLYLFLGGIIGWLKQQIDVLIENEAFEKRRLQTIIEQLPVGILITDQNGRLTQRNKQVDKILGAKIPLGFQIGHDQLPNVRIDGEIMKPNESPISLALSSGKPTQMRELLYQRNDGKKLTLQVSSAPIHNKKQQVIAAASIINDVTKQKELERQKDEFLGVASHELKTPVTSIKAYTQVLQQLFTKKGDTKSADLLGKLDAQINKLTALIADLLDVTKIQAGQLQLRMSHYRFNDLVKEIVEEVGRTSVKHKIKMSLDKDHLVYGDKERVGQVITNLLTNAIKYSPRAKDVLLTTTSDTDTLTLCVKDAGIGIPPEKQARIFERFYRVDREHEETYPGLGLGLYISSAIIKRQGGKIWVNSTPQKGSTFCFTLPIQKQSQQKNTVDKGRKKHA